MGGIKPVRVGRCFIRALIDSDILIYEAAFAGQDKETGEVHSFDYVREVFDSKVEDILRHTDAGEFTLYLSGPENFRTSIAKTKPYKGTRKQEKPWHYENLRTYIQSLGNSVLTDGIEADDAICIEQTKRLAQADTIICTRDKDLRICPGYHFGWEHGNQPEFFPQWVEKRGVLTLVETTSGKGIISKEIKGTGLLFFYSQLITGDSTDNIPGLPKGGPVLAYELLKNCEEEVDMFNAVRTAYEIWGRKNEIPIAQVREYLIEQAQLLWMIQELDDEGKPVMWRPPIDWA